MVQKAKTISSISKKTRKKSKKPLIITLIIILVLAVVSTAALLVYFNWPKNEEKKTETGTAETEKKDDSTKKEGEKEDSKTPDNSTPAEDGKNNSQYEGTDPNTSESLTGIINYTGIASGLVSVRATIDQYITGTCVFTMTSPSGSQTVESTENTTTGPMATYCSVDFYAQQFAESGTWKISIKVSGDNKIGTITGEMQL